MPRSRYEKDMADERKERKSARFTVRLTDAELARLQAGRAAGARTLSDVVRNLIREHLRTNRPR